MKCEVCGSTDLIKENGNFVCKGCGMKYTLDEVKKLNNSFSTITTNLQNSPTAITQENKPIDSKLAKVAGICALIAMILTVAGLIIDYINLSFFGATFKCIFIFLAAKNLRNIYKGKSGSDALRKVPAALLGWDIYAVLYGTICSINDFTFDMLIPVIFDAVLLLEIIFISKELPEKNFKKSKIITIIGAVFAFIKNQLINTILYDPDCFFGGRRLNKVQYFFNQFKRPFMPVSTYKFTAVSVIDRITNVFNNYVFLITFLILLGLVFMVFAVQKGEIKESENSEKTANAAKVKAYLLAGVILIPVMLAGGWLLSGVGSSGNGGSSRGPGSTCIVQGCNNKAVGPTYEFCSKHEGLLHEVWELER